MTVAIVGPLALIGLVAVGLFLPLQLIPAAVLAVLWALYVARTARAGGDPERVEARASRCSLGLITHARG